ncbi:MAG: extracellular solute-binding protein [Deltaproteobacteria bacterium]|nr:extracellular solute-binding protein [Deltaproteobacteria bacterium]
MKRSRFVPISVLTFLVLLVWGAGAQTVTLEQLIEGARKEGRLEFHAPSSLTPPGAQALADAFNKTYGLRIAINYNPSGGMARDVSKVVAAATAGAPPEWDAMVVTDAHHATLAGRNLHHAIDYNKLGIDPRITHYGNGTISIANEFVLPAYNHNVLPAKDVPKSWDDLLDPKWKGGKLGMSPATHHLARLAAGAWGEEKTTRYVRSLSQQGLSLGTFGQLYSRLQLGEVLVAVTMIDGFIYRAKVTGAPVVHAEGIEPLISPALHAGVLKGARHPNAGYLIAVFLTTLRAQEIWEKHRGDSSAFIPGTTAYKRAQGKHVLYMSDKDADFIDRLAREYARILGFK